MAKTNAKTSNLKQIKKTIVSARLTITSRINNTFMTLAHLNGDVISVFSCGKIGIKNSKKNTPFAIEKLCSEVLNFLKDTSVKTMEIFINGNISANFISKFDGCGIIVSSITSVENKAHNGVRLPREKKK